jgi:hypothetical protein
MQKYFVETVSIFRHRYVIEAERSDHACDEVVCNDGNLKEFSQHHVDENIFSVREISDEEYLKQFNEDNQYLSSWADEEKFKFVNKIDYNK